MAAIEDKQDKHFPAFAHDNPFRRLFGRPQKLVRPYVANGRVVADLGCGPGFYTLALADLVGPEGKVYAVDSDEKVIRTVEKEAGERGHRNIEARTSSASDLSFIKDGSVDFILAHGLLCSMAPHRHEATVKEMKRVLKPSGQAYLSAAKGFYSYMSQEEWEKILEGFRVERRGDGFYWLGDRWAVVSLK